MPVRVWLGDPDRVGIMGFSRGGLLALQAAIARPDDLRAIVLMAPAPGRNALDMTLRDVSPIAAPVSIYVAENDVFMAEHVQIAEEVHRVLQDAGKDSNLTIYPPFGDDGHEIFFEVRDSYFTDLLAFFDAQMQ